ncbi:MAG: hypothetical protein WAQ28_19255 [Bacteroidia bacterium]
MDIILTINLLLIFAFAFLKQKNSFYTTFYSFSLLLGILTCMYLFYRYGMREMMSTKSVLHFYSSPFLFALGIFLIYQQRKSTEGLRIIPFLSNALSAETKKKYNKILPAVILYIAISGLCYLAVDVYESNLPPPGDHEPFRYSMLLTHPLWQFFYIVPFTALFWLMELRKFALTFASCSVIYTLTLILLFFHF